MSWKQFKFAFLENRSFMIGSVSFLGMVLLVTFGPWIFTKDPVEMNFSSILQPPGAEGIFGTDEMGRDLLSRVLHGGRTSLSIGLQVMIVTAIFGTLVGLVTGYFDKIDNILMRFMDILMSFPALLLAIAILATMGNNPSGVIIALSIVYGPRTARVVRGVVLSLKENDYVAAAQALGSSNTRILLLHVLPGVVPALVVQESFLFGYAILGEAGLSFVGVGIQPPAPSWGNIMGDARVLIRDAPWMMFIPGLALMYTVLALNLMGDGLRDALNPRRVTGSTVSESESA